MCGHQAASRRINRLNMLTRWFAVAAFLAGSANPRSAAAAADSVSVAPSCRVRGHPEVELTLNCGDGKTAGVVQFWHTPFGDLRSPGSHSKLDPVLMRHDGSLVVPNSSVLHSGLYYCLLQHTEGTTLWPYELHIGQYHQKDRGHEQGSSCAVVRLSSGVGSEDDEAGGFSDEEFAGAVAASVLLTFVLGFSVGALSRTQVLRCLDAVTKRLRPSGQQGRTVDGGPMVTMTTWPPMYQDFEMGQEDGSVNCASAETTISSAASSPPAKPKRSFCIRNKREAQKETAAYLEGCDHTKEEKEEARRVEEKNKGCEGEEEFSGIYLFGGDKGSQRAADQDGEEKSRRESREEERQFRQEEKDEEENKQCIQQDEEEKGPCKQEDEEERKFRQEEKDEKENKQCIQQDEEEKGPCKQEEDEERQFRQEDEEEKQLRQEEDKERQCKQEKDEEEERQFRQDEEEKKGPKEEAAETEKEGYKEKSEDSQQSSTEREDDETGSETRENTKTIIVERGEAPALSPPCAARRSRVIRLYQYDENGQRYCHLPDPDVDQPGPDRPRQRSVSLTRLSAIMAAAAAGPLDRRETGREEEEGSFREHFHMNM